MANNVNKFNYVIATLKSIRELSFWKGQTLKLDKENQKVKFNKVHYKYEKSLEYWVYSLINNITYLNTKGCNTYIHPQETYGLETMAQKILYVTKLKSTDHKD